MNTTPTTRNLQAYRNDDFDPGRGIVMRTLWFYVSLILFESGWFPVRWLKVAVLRVFGAKVGQGVVVHPNIRIKFPWKLSVGDHCWIGRDVWIDNLDYVTLESDVCISQGAYLCTGSHDHKSETFELRTAPIILEHGAWVCCRATVLGGAILRRMSIVPANGVYSRNTEESGQLDGPSKTKLRE